MKNLIRAVVAQWSGVPSGSALAATAETVRYDFDSQHND